MTPNTAANLFDVPCPWCSCHDVKIHIVERLATTQDGSACIVRLYAIECDRCQARGAFALTRYDAAKYWCHVAQAFEQARHEQQTPNEATDREEHAAEQARMDGLLPDTARGGQ